MKLHELTIQAAHELLQKKEITSVELTRAVLDRIDAIEEKVNAFLTVSADMAIEQAKAADKAIFGGNCRPLTGIPVAIKDLIASIRSRTARVSSTELISFFCKSSCAA